jgi:anthranilate phosphoribosyltransferase
MASDILKMFLKSRASTNVEECAGILTDLRPDKLLLEEIIELITWVEATKKHIEIDGQHVNTFGTGGDGTTNITSMASVLASRFVRVVKIGTRAVTSQYGSADFFQELNSKKNAFHAGSQFIPLVDLGFEYSETTKAARCYLHRNQIPDIYKVIFPFANYTNPRMQINGVSSLVYFHLFENLAQALKRNVMIVHSMHGIDELMPGKNRIVAFWNGAREALEWSFFQESGHRVWKIFKERKSTVSTVRLFQRINTNEADPVIIQTIFYNAALLLVAHSIGSSFHEDLRTTMQKSLTIVQASLEKQNM